MSEPFSLQVASQSSNASRDRYERKGKNICFTTSIDEGSAEIPFYLPISVGIERGSNEKVTKISKMSTLIISNQREIDNDGKVLPFYPESISSHFSTSKVAKIKWNKVKENKKENSRKWIIAIRVIRLVSNVSGRTWQPNRAEQDREREEKKRVWCCIGCTV